MSADRNRALFAARPGTPGELEAWAARRGYRSIAGVDEVGRGPLAGPVVAAAVVLHPERGIQRLDDSKRLTARKREELAAEIDRLALAWGLGVVGPARIDEINIRAASLESMSIAVGQLLAAGVVPDLVLVDGRDGFTPPEGAPPFDQRAFVKADGRSLAVAAASILAKVYRDALMQEYHACWPQYGFDQHKGYPTKAHRQALEQHGPCEIHRRSFRGV